MKATSLMTAIASCVLFSTQALAADLSFIIMGDSGTGNAKQYKAANAMNAVCQQKGCDTVFGLGDNIYEFGAWSVNDKQFIDKFEAPYANMNMPFFMALGNHDTSGLIPGDGAMNPRGSYEVNYTKHSKKWKMPNRYYTVNDAKSSSLFIVYDSTPPNAYVVPFWDPYWWPKGTYMKQQKAWVQKELTKAKNSSTPPKWKFALAHHPIITNGHHEDDSLAQGKQPYADFMDSFCGKVDFIFSGHEHSLELLNNDNTQCQGTHLLVSGAAGKNNGKPGKQQFSTAYYQYGKLGFYHAAIRGNKFTVTAYAVSEDGSYQADFTKTFTK